MNSDYTTMDLNLAYAVCKGWSVSGGVENIADADLPENMAWRGVPDDPAGRYYYIGVKVEF